ncbi:MAG: beta-propeller fold lactonase family protein [Deltaproteobacteria bacterium]|nr:beta-propeller fold lactonase family protein [Deltaproteobacteria bacterium]
MRHPDIEEAIRRAAGGRGAWLSLLLVCIASCNATGSPSGPITRLPDIVPEPVAASWSVELNLDHGALDTTLLSPTADPVRVETAVAADGLSLHAFVKRARGRDGFVWLDLFAVSTRPTGLRDVALAITSSTEVSLVDWTNDPFADAPITEPLQLGRMAPEGFVRASVGVRATTGRVVLTLRLEGTASAYTSRSSSPIAMSPDGSEVWAAFPDGDVVAVLDAASDSRVAQVAIEGRPRSVAITPDGRFVLIAAASANTVTVVERASRQVVRVFGEDDGIGREPRHVVVAPDGSRALVSAYVGDTLTSLVRRGDRFEVEASVAVGRRPSGLSIAPDSRIALVAHFLPRGTVSDNEGWISTVTLDPLALRNEVTIHDHFNADSAHCIADVFGVSPERLVTEGVPTQLAGVFLDPAGNEGWTPGTRAAGSAIAWEAGPGGREGLEALVSLRPGELVPPFVFLFDTRRPEAAERTLVPGALERPVSPDYVRCARFQAELELVDRHVIPSAPDQQVNNFLAFPSGIAGLSESGVMRFVGFTRGGRRALLLSHVADEIVLFDAMTHHPASQLHLTLSGSNPTGLVTSPDGRKAYVAYDGSTFVSVLDLARYADPAALPGPSYVPYEFREVTDVPQTGVAFMSQLLVRHVGDVPERPEITERAQIPLVDLDPVEPILRRGGVLFASANPDKHPRLSLSRNGACASCHPDGGNDGTMWGTMEGERRTMSLRGGVAGRGWLHASATHRDIREFAETIVAERLGGSLPEDDVEALSTYVARGIPRLQSPRVDAALARRGRAVFEASCSRCHQGEQLSSGNPDPTDRWGGGHAAGPELFDVGTATSDAHVILGTFFESLLSSEEADLLRSLRGDRTLGRADGAQRRLRYRERPDRERGLFKAPSLVGVFDEVLLFHDGRFTRIEEAVQHLVDNLGLALSAEDQRAVIEYVRTL